jgi:hypothetical protein
MLVAIEPQGFNMNKFLIGFTYHEPESWELFQKGIIEDCESSTGVYITAPRWGRQ